MSTGWHIYVIALTAVSILWTFWLIFYSGKQGPEPDANSQDTGHTWDGLRENNNPLPRWWLGLFLLTLVWGIGYLIYYPGLGNFSGVGGWTQLGAYEEEVTKAEAKFAPIFAEFATMPASELVRNQKALSIGKSLFANYCSQCHGSVGYGARGFPNLADDDWLYGGDFDAIQTSIRNGRNGVMPGLGGAFPTDKSLKAMVDYVQTLSGEPDTSSPAHQQYVALCGACHGPTGDGMALLGAPRLNDDIWLYGSSDASLRQTIAEGRQGVMPAHDKLLGDDRIRLLTAYVYSLSNQDSAAGSD